MKLFEGEGHKISSFLLFIVDFFGFHFTKMDKDAIIDFKGETFMEILLVDYRWLIVCFFLLPMSFLYNLWFYVRNAIIFHLNSAPRAHDTKVKKIQQQVISTETKYNNGHAF